MFIRKPVKLGGGDALTKSATAFGSNACGEALILDPTGQRFPTAIPTTSQRGNELEINDRRYAEACDLAQVASLGNADNDGRQDDRYDDNSDRLDKDIAQWPEGLLPGPDRRARWLLRG